MKGKNIILLGVSLLLLTAAVFLILSGKESSLRDRDRNFRVEADLNVTRIEMQGSDGNAVILERDADGYWRVNHAFRANESAVRELLGTLRNLNVRLPVPLSDKESVNASLENEGTLLEVYANAHLIILSDNLRLLPRNRRIKTFLVGSDTPDGESTYMRIFSSALPFAVHVPGVRGGLSGIFSTSESLWRDPVVVDLTPQQVKRLVVEFTDMDSESYSVEKTGLTPVFFQNGQAIDSLKLDWPRVVRFFESFSELHYERLLTGFEDSIRQAEMITPPFLSIRVTDHLGRETAMHFFRRKAPKETTAGLAPTGVADPNRFYLQVNQGEFARAQYFVFNRIMRPLSYFKKAGH